jgi:hypothetical protein
MNRLRLSLLIALTLLVCGASNFGPIAASRLRSSGGGSGFDPETDTWISRVNAAGGTYEADSKALADALIIALKAKSYEAKIVYLLPLLGSNLAAARVPLRDSIGVGIAGNSNFVDGDFSQATGLQGNGSTKILDSKIKPSQLGTSFRGGIGYWETNMNLSGHVEPIGCYSSGGGERFVLDLRSTPFKAFRFGDPSPNVSDPTTPTNGHYYGNRSGTTDLRIYFNGALLATQTGTNGTTGFSDTTMGICGSRGTASDGPWPGRCAAAYFTDGTMSDADVADFHTMLDTYLITPTGR